MKKFTLLVDGEEKNISKDLLAVLERYFPDEATQQVTTFKKVKSPVEDEWFEVQPQLIDQSLFQDIRKDSKQEITRQLILEAFEELKKYPERYGKNFKTKMPKKTWTIKTVDDLKKIACKLGSHNADWVEQSLEWAQRISNGESWNTVCNEKDTAYWQRLVIWKGNDCACIVGGSCYTSNNVPASNVDNKCYDSKKRLYNIIPLIIDN